MAITNLDKIDFISTRDMSKAILTISDHLDWNDVGYHLITLQTKLNAYIAFIESGEIYEVYPDAKNKSLTIDIVSEYEFSTEGIRFLKQVSPVLNSIGVELTQRTIIAR
jgi:hypothetical protein